MPRVVHFEVHADDTNRASDFYNRVFGWRFDKWDGPEEYFLIKTGQDGEPGIDGGLMKRHSPAGSVYNTIQVSSVDDYIKKISDNGGEIVVPKTPVPGVGYLAYFKDTEGNIFGIMHPDTEAK
jgi:predicted enzyme related to lactoylglutathione lyase